MVKNSEDVLKDLLKKYAEYSEHHFDNIVNFNKCMNENGSNKYIP
jgi:hypothetical protein